MLHPKKDRLYYLNALTPDSNQEVNMAICFTYSLDFQTLLAASTYLSMDKNFYESFENGNQSDLFVVEKIRQLNKKLLVYADSAQIKVPAKYKDFYTLFDSCINKYKEKINGAFHPKMWIVEYKRKDCGEQNIFDYRLLISSRNLAPSSNLDFGVCLNGTYQHIEGKYKNNKFNSSLTKFLSSLNEDKLFDLIENLKSVKFRCSTKDFSLGDNAISIFSKETINIANREITNSIIDADKKSKNKLIVSPFLDSNIVRLIYQNTEGKFILVTNEDSLCEIPDDIVQNQKTEIYTLSDAYFCGDGDEENEDNKFNGIHAKLYLIENKDECHLIIGSSNCTRNGLGWNNTNNVESDVKITTKKESFDSLKKELLAEDYNFLKRIDYDFFLKLKEDIKNDEDTDDFKIEQEIFKAFLENNFTGSYDPSSQLLKISSFDNKWSGVDHINEFKLYIYPACLGDSKRKEVVTNQDIIFSEIPLIKASNFFVLEIRKKREENGKNGKDDRTFKRVFLVNLKEGLEGRDQEILNLHFKNDDDVLSYLHLLLSDNYYSLREGGRNSQDINNESSSIYELFDTLGIYDEALKKAYFDPEGMKEIIEKMNNLPAKCRENEFIKRFIEVFGALGNEDNNEH